MGDMTSLQWMNAFELSAREHFEKHPVWEGAQLELSRIVQLESGTCYLRLARVPKTENTRSVLASLELRAMSVKPGQSAFQGMAAGMHSKASKRFFINENAPESGFALAIEALDVVLEEPKTLESKSGKLEDKTEEDALALASSETS